MARIVTFDDQADRYDTALIQFSPFPNLPWHLNSQIFLVARSA
jgi:hypothetical protein